VGEVRKLNTRRIPSFKFRESDSDRKRYGVAWLLCLIFYAMEYSGWATSIHNVTFFKEGLRLVL
jgi:hypothetical protein